MSPRNALPKEKRRVKLSITISIEAHEKLKSDPSATVSAAVDKMVLAYNPRKERKS